MKKYLKKFIRFKLTDKSKSNAYFFCFWALYKNFSNKNERYRSNYIKSELSALDFNTFPINEKRIKAIQLSDRCLSQTTHQLFFEHRSSLDSIQIKNFRGFGCSPDPQDNGTFIKFNWRKNIFYAPNGGGKTSLCEAIEYTVTKDIKEAIRRKTPLGKYIKRGNDNHTTTLHFSDSSIKVPDLSEIDNEAYKKCFIERNRLQEFALLGSKDTKTDERDIIASVLGLEDFDEYISSLVLPSSFNVETLFSNEAKNDYISFLESQNDSLKRKEIEAERLHDTSLQIKSLLNIDDFQNDDLQNEKERITKRIKTLQNEILELRSSTLKEIDIDKLIKSIRLCKFKVLSLNILKKETDKCKSEIDYSRLYEAIISIEQQNPENCPACGTSLDIVKYNPFENAKEEIEKLSDIRKNLTTIEKLNNFLKEESYQYIITSFSKFKHNIENYANLTNETVTQQLETLIGFSDRIEAISSICNFLSQNISLLDQYKDVQNTIIKEIDTKSEIIQEKQIQIQELNDNLQSFNTLASKYNESINSISSMDTRLETFQNLKEQKKRALKKERKYNRFVKKLGIAYKLFHKDIVEFKLEIERNQLQSIEGNLLRYYKLINKSDSPDETIKSIKLNQSKDNYRIIITRLNDIEEDAFVSLSEGHLRSLGLAIMLSISRKYDVPFIVFDDVINAIDSDHRANIIEMIYQDNFFNQRQLILTTHDRLFWERFCNSHPNRDSSISFILSYTNYGIIVKQYKIDFDQKISDALNNYDIRQVLVYCRIWFESITINYLKEKGASVTAKYSTRINGTNPTATLESIYSLMESEIKDKQYFNKIKRDLINWAGQNQAHHSFSEDDYNFIHSKTSAEVTDIYHAVKSYVQQIETLIQQLRVIVN